MVEVFSTNVQEAAQSDMLSILLLEHFPGSRISFDLDDCDKVLRVEGKGVIPEMVIHILGTRGYQCRSMD